MRGFGPAEVSLDIPPPCPSCTTGHLAAFCSRGPRQSPFVIAVALAPLSLFLRVMAAGTNKTPHGMTFGPSHTPPLQ